MMRTRKRYETITKKYCFKNLLKQKGKKLCIIAKQLEKIETFTGEGRKWNVGKRP